MTDPDPSTASFEVEVTAVVLARRSQSARFIVEDIDESSARIVGRMQLVVGERIQITFGESITLDAQVARVLPRTELADDVSITFCDVNPVAAGRLRELRLEAVSQRADEEPTLRDEGPAGDVHGSVSGTSNGRRRGSTG